MPRGGRLAAWGAVLLATLLLGGPAGAQSAPQSANQPAATVQTGDAGAPGPQPTEADLDDAVPGVKIVQYDSSDPYAMSIELASALVASAGGTSEWAVLASGESWAEAAAAGPLAVSLGAPVLLVPPGGLQSPAARPDLVELLRSAGTRRVVIVGSSEVLPNHEPSVLFGLGMLPRNIERVHGADPVGTSIAVAERMGLPAEMEELGRTVIIASDQSVTDAAAVGPLAAAGPFPLLLTAPDTLDPRITAYLAQQEIAHVVLAGGPAAIAPAVQQAIEDTDITVTRLAGQNRYHTAALAMDLLAEVPRCADAAIDSVGLALAEEPLLALTAAHLLGPKCIPLLFTDTDRLAPITQNHLYLFRHRTGVEPNWHLIGDDVTIDPSAIEHPPVRMATVADNPDGDGQHIVVLDEHHQARRFLLDAGFSWITQVRWSSEYGVIELWGGRDDEPQPYLLDTRTAELRRRPPKAQPWYLALAEDDWVDLRPSADRKHILYRAPTEQHAGHSIFLYDVEAGSSRMLTHNDTDDTHHILRSRSLDDSRYIYFRQAVDELESECGGVPSSEVGVLDIGEGTTYDLPFEGYVIDSELSFSPDDTHVVLAVYPEYAYSPGYDPGYDPDYGLFWSCTYYGLGIPQLLVYDISGSRPILASDTRIDGLNPWWSPDGNHLVFQAPSGGHTGYSLFVLDLDGGNVDQLTQNDSNEYHHVPDHWRPGGDRLVYAVQRIEELESSCFGLVSEQLRRSNVPLVAAYVVDLGEQTSTRIPFNGFASGIDTGVILDSLPGGNYVDLGADGNHVFLGSHTGYYRVESGLSCLYGFELPPIESYAYDLSGNTPKAVSRGGLVNVSSQPSPDNGYIAYLKGNLLDSSVRPGYLILNTHTNSTWPIDPSDTFGPDARLCCLAWSKNSRHIIFRVHHSGSPYWLPAVADVGQRVLSPLDLTGHSGSHLRLGGFSPDGWQVIHKSEHGPAGLLHVNSVEPSSSLIHMYDLFAVSEPTEPAYAMLTGDLNKTGDDFAFQAYWTPKGILAAGYYFRYICPNCGM